MGLQDFLQVLGPRFYLEAQGDLADDLIPYISSFEFEDHESKADVLKIHVANPQLVWKDDERFQEGARWRCRFGYASDMSDAKNFVLSKAKPHYPQSGLPTIEMVGYSLQQDMNHDAKPRNWGAISSSDVAAAIAARYQFATDIENSQDARAQARIQSAGVTDFQYLVQLASKLNWDFYIESATLHFHHKRYDTPAVLSFTYYTDGTGTLLKFDPEVKLNQPTGTNAGAAGTSNRNANTAAGNGSGAADTRQYNVDVNSKTLTPGVSNGPRGSVGTGVTLPTSESDPRVIALHGAAVAQKIDMSAVKAGAEFVGSPQIRARTMIAINGVDRYYAGNWRVASSRHKIDVHGYRTDVQLRRDAGESAGKSNNLALDPLSGQLKPRNLIVDANTKQVTGQ